MAQTTEKKWYLVDLNDVVLGRAATQIADIIRGKDRATYQPNLDNGNFVVAINASKVKLTGNKMEKKKYYHHTGFFGGIKEATAKQKMSKSPAKLVSETVWGMMPKSNLSRHMMKKLKVYSGNEHPHTAQSPQPITLKG